MSDNIKAINPREQTVQFWVSRGAPRHVAEGIADRVKAESGFNPTVPGDKGTSVGLYQHHADRKARLMALPSWQDPMTQHQFAYMEVTGGDPIATKHWNEIRSAPDRATAAKLWDKYFERSAAGVGAGGGTAAGSRRMVGRLGGMGPLVPNGAEIDLDTPKPVGTPRPAPPMPSAAAAPAPPDPGVTAAPPPAATAPQPFAPRPVPVPGGPDLGSAYQDALSAVLNGRRRPFGSIYGE